MKRSLLVFGIVIGAFLALGPLWGFFGIVLGMKRGFSVLGSSGIQDPGELSGAISTTLLATSLGIFLCPVGIVIFAVCLVLLIKLPKPKARFSPSHPPTLPS